MEHLIPLINSLQSVFKKTGMEEIKLPQIVVVGPQSSGKSSVLESLVKKSFLPRGTGIVTRCPIILQLNQLKDDQDAGDCIPFEWCRFSKNPEKCYTDFDEVREEIEELQVEMAGDKKGISMEPIILEVYSPNVIDLTVVDLPGIVKLAVEGQPFDIEQQVHDLLMKYISNESAIILAVSAANADISTSESIKLAKSVDPEGDRTLAVLTKLDLMDKGTDASSVLQGELIKVKLGIIGVVNRGQADINKNTSMGDAKRKEEDFLRKAYPHIPNIGSPYLALRLNQLLKEHIHKNLPDLIKRISNLTFNCQKELDILGPTLSTSPQDCSWEIMKTATKFVTKLSDTVRFRSLLFTDEDQVPFAVSVNEAFQQLRDEIEIKLVDLQYIHRSLRNTLNFESYASIEEVFKHIVKLMLKKMERPAANCAKKIHDLLSATTKNCFTDTRLKHLNAMIQRVVDDLLESQLKDVLLGIKEHIKVQQGMVSSSDEKFANLLANEPMKNEEDEENEKEEKIKELQEKVSKLEVQLNIKKDLEIKAFSMHTKASLNNDEEATADHVQGLINAYLVVAKRELCDYIPKYIIYHLADQTLEKIMDAIKIATIGKEVALMSEPPEITFRRNRQLELLKNLKDADKIIKEIRITW